MTEKDNKKQCEDVGKKMTEVLMKLPLEDLLDLGFLAIYGIGGGKKCYSDSEFILSLRADIKKNLGITVIEGSPSDNDAEYFVQKSKKEEVKQRGYIT